MSNSPQTIMFPSIKACLEQDEWKDFKTTEEDKMEFIKETMEQAIENLQQQATEIFWELFEDGIRSFVIKEKNEEEEEEMNSRIICETCSRDFTDECDDRSSFDEIGKVICMECFDKEDDRDKLCEGCGDPAEEECSSCDNISCSECIEEFSRGKTDPRCRVCGDDEPDTEDEEEEDLSFKKQYEKHLTDKENWDNIAPMKDWTPQDHKELDSYIKSGKLIASKQYPGSWIENEEEEEKEYEFYDYGCSKVYKVVIQVAGGGLGNGNAYATVEGEWACEDDFNNGEDGEIYYCEYGNYPKKDYRGNRLIFNDEGTSFNIE